MDELAQRWEGILELRLKKYPGRTVPRRAIARRGRMLMERRQKTHPNGDSASGVDAKASYVPLIEIAIDRGRGWL
jgi:hypothetical protein